MHLKCEWNSGEFITSIESVLFCEAMMSFQWITWVLWIQILKGKSNEKPKRPPQLLPTGDVTLFKKFREDNLFQGATETPQTVRSVQKEARSSQSNNPVIQVKESVRAVFLYFCLWLCIDILVLFIDHRQLFAIFREKHFPGLHAYLFP